MAPRDAFSFSYLRCITGFAADNRSAPGAKTRRHLHDGGERSGRVGLLDSTCGLDRCDLAQWARPKVNSGMGRSTVREADFTAT